MLSVALLITVVVLFATTGFGRLAIAAVCAFTVVAASYWLGFDHLVLLITVYDRAIAYASPWIALEDSFMLRPFAAFLSLVLVAVAPAGAGISGFASVTDGDTLRIGSEGIRLHGIDALESNSLREGVRGVIGSATQRSRSVARPGRMRCIRPVRRVA